MRALAVMYVLLIPCVILFVRSKHKAGGSAPLTVALKAASTTVIALTAVAGLAGVRESMRSYAVLVAAALILGLVGDVVICQPEPGGFLSGMVYFALGHLCYIGAFLQVSTHAAWAVPVFLVLYGGFLTAVVHLAKKFANMLVPTAIYGAVIAAMLSLSATAPFSLSRGFILTAAAVLFAVSDGLLAYNTYSGAGNTNELSFLRHCCSTFHQLPNGSRPLDWVSLCCYFAGQSLFAASVFCL